MSHYDNQGRRVLSGNLSTWEAEAKALLADNERLRMRLADCVSWMDTREKQVPGMPRICDMARAALEGTSHD